jgi:four helix bundle protein
VARARDYESLVLWQKSMDLVDAVYSLCAQWPQQEHFRLVNQIRRVAISIPANIAEGYGRTGTKEFLHHLSIASGSLSETETLLSIALRQRYLPLVQFELVMSQADEVRRLALGMMAALRKRTNQ